MSLIRPRPRHVYDVEDAFERLYSASPMSKLVPSDSALYTSHLDLSFTSVSSVKRPTSVTPKAKIFSQLKKSEGNLSSDNLAADHGRYGQFAAGITDNADSNRGRSSLERPQPGVNGHYEWHKSRTNSSYLQERSSHLLRPKLHDGPVVEPGTESVVFMSPRIEPTRLDGSSAANRDPVVRGQNDVHRLYDLQEEGYCVEEESRSVGSEDDLPSHGEEQDRVELVSEGPGLEENKSPGDRTEGRFSEQTRKCSSDIREQRRRVQLRRVIPEESDTSEEEEENVGRTETSRRKHQPELREESIDGVNVGVREASAERRESSRNGSKQGGRQSSEEEEERNEDRPAMALRSSRKHHSEEEEEHEESNVNRRTKVTSRNRRKHVSDDESVDDVDTRDVAASKYGMKVSKDERGQSSEEDEECKVSRRTNLRSRNRRKQVSDDESFYEADTSDTAASVERRKDSSYGKDRKCQDIEEDEEYEECKVSRRTRMISRNRRNHVSDATDDSSIDTEVRTTLAPQDRMKNEGTSRLRKERSDYKEYKDDRSVAKLTKVKHVTNGSKSRQSLADRDGDTITKNTTDIDFTQKGSSVQIETQPTTRRRSKRLDDGEDTVRSTSSRKKERNRSPVVVSSSSEDSADSAEPDKSSKDAVAVVGETFQRVTRNMSSREKSRESEDHVRSKKVSMDGATETGKTEVKVKVKATTNDLDETPAASRKLLKVKAGQQHTLENWTILQLGRNIGVDGHRVGDPPKQFWHSNAIVKRLSSHAVATVSGTVYTLRGRMVEDKALTAGFSTKVVAAFLKGFPPTWKETIQEYLEGKHSKRLSKTDCKKLKTPVQKKPAKSKQHSRIRDIIATPDSTVSISSLPQTRSGRHVIPQLAWWTGERVTVDPILRSIDIVPGTPNTQCASVPSDSYRRRRMLNPDPALNSEPPRNRVTTKLPASGKQQAGGAKSKRRGHGEDGDNGREKRDKRGHGSNKDNVCAPVKRPQHHRKVVARSLETSDSEVTGEDTPTRTTPTQQLFSECHARPTRAQTKAQHDAGSDAAQKPVGKLSEVLVKTLSFLEQRGRIGNTASTKTVDTETQNGRLVHSTSNNSYVSNSSCSSGHPDHGMNIVNRLDCLNGVTSASQTAESEGSVGISSSKNRLAGHSFKPVNLTKDIHAILRENRKTNVQRRKEESETCYSRDHGGSVGDSSGSGSDSDSAGDVVTQPKGSRHLNGVCRDGETNNSTPRAPQQHRRLSDIKQLDVLVTRDRVGRRSRLSDAPTKTPVSRYDEHLTHDILCRSVENKRLSYSDADNHPNDVHSSSSRQRNGSNDKSKVAHTSKSGVPPGDKERKTKRDDKVTHSNGKERNGRCDESSSSDSSSNGKQRQPFVRGSRQLPVTAQKSLSSDIKGLPTKKQPRRKQCNDAASNRKDSSLPQSKRNVSSVDDSEDKTFKPQKASKPSRKTSAKSASAASDKQGKQSGMFEGGVGTLKRKRQLREFVEQHECGHENDLFDSTPFRQQKSRKITTLLGNDAVDDFFAGAAGQVSFATPGTTPSSSACRAWFPTSDQKTPASYTAASPLLPPAQVNRNAIDRYVHKVKKVTKKKTKPLPVVANAASSGAPPTQGRSTKTLATMSPRVFQMANRSHDVDSSNADDYYFSDGSDSA